MARFNSFPSQDNACLECSPGTPASPLSRPGPPARTLWAPPSPSGPTVNWKGLPVTCWPRYLTLTVWTPISWGTNRTQCEFFPMGTISASVTWPEGLVTWADMSLLSISEREQEIGGLKQGPESEQDMQGKQQRARRLQLRGVGCSGWMPALLSPSSS